MRQAQSLAARVAEWLRSFAGLGDRVSLRVTTFGRQVDVIGAAALALDAFFYGQDRLPVA